MKEKVCVCLCVCVWVPWVHNVTVHAYVCVGVHNSTNLILCKCTLCEWVFKSTLTFFCAHMCLLINGNPLLMLFIMTLFMAHILCLSVHVETLSVCWCVCLCVQDRGCESRGWEAAVHRRAGHSDHWEHDRHLHRPGETAAAQQEHRAAASQQRGTAAADSLQLHVLYCWCWQLHVVLSKNQRRTVGVVLKLLLSCEESTLKLRFSKLYNPSLLDFN